MKNKILICEPYNFSAKAIDKLKEWGDVVCLTSLSELDNHLFDTNVIVIRLGVNWTSQLLSRLPLLQYILTPTTGLDHIDMDYALGKEIKVISLKGEQAFLDNIPSTAEHSMALMLAVVRKLVPAHQHVMQDGWNRQAFRGNNLKGKKFGILGFGRIGHQMANYTLAFGMQVFAFDPSSNYSNDRVEFLSSPEELFSESDIIGIHIPLNKHTENFVSSHLLESAKKGLILINTSRGGVWDEKAVADGILSGRLAAVATDVIEHELNSELRVKSSLIELAKAGYPILITPHIGGATFESMHDTEEFIAQLFIHRL